MTFHSRSILSKFIKASLIAAVMPVSAHAALTPITAQSTKIWPQISAVNHVSFIKSKFNPEGFVGNGFLLSYSGRIYAITAKHVLLRAKTDAMKTIDLSGQLKSWRLRVNKDPAQYVELGRLVNSNSKEALNIDVLERDWLVFEVKQNHSKLVPLVMREGARAAMGTKDDDAQPLTGEVLYALGCSYARKKECQQDVYSGKLVGHAANNLLVQLDDTKSRLGGLSGAPVVDAQQRLVGIVSNFMTNPNAKGDVFAPANLDYLRAVLKADTRPSSGTNAPVTGAARFASKYFDLKCWQ